MATPRFVGNAVAVAQVDTLTVGGTVEADDLFLSTINGKALSVTAGSTVVATVATTFAAAWNALDSTIWPEFAEVTAAATAGGALTLTGDTAGYPFTETPSTTEAGGGAADLQTFTKTATTACSGPNFYSTAANWDTAAAPAGGDTVYIDNSDVDILYGLSNAGATLAAIYIAKSYTGDIGLPKFNSNAVEYPEYRTDYLAIDATIVDVGGGPGLGSRRIKINNGSVQTAVTVHGTGFPAETSLEAFLWKGTHASNTLTVADGSVGVAVFGGEVATILTLKVDGGNVRLGAGVTLGTATVNGGTVEINCAVATLLTVYGGTVTINGTGAVASLKIYGGRVIYNSTGTLGGAPEVYNPGVLDFSQNPATKTVTNPIDTNWVGGVNDPDKVVTSLIVDYDGVAPIRQLGSNVRLTRGTPA